MTSLNNLRAQVKIIPILGYLVGLEKQVCCSKSPRVKGIVLHTLPTWSPCLPHHLNYKYKTLTDRPKKGTSLKLLTWAYPKSKKANRKKPTNSKRSFWVPIVSSKMQTLGTLQIGLGKGEREGPWESPSMEFGLLSLP